jgi:hypothetical protein
MSIPKRSLLFAFLILTTVAARSGLLDNMPISTPNNSLTPAEHRRGAEQTFLTFPEWFLVHSPAEYAAYARDHTPSDFPFLGHIRQFWQSYGNVYAATDEYPFNFGYHVMIFVIGTSTTVEYGIRSAYETLIGRLSEATQSGGLTEEDRYGAKVAQEYVDFIRVRPWYEFDFIASLKGLWSKTSLSGPDMIRKWERKYALTTEYAIKAAYGWLIMLATRASYDEAGDTTCVILDSLPAGIEASLPKLKVLQHLPDGGVLATVPRYQAFSDYARILAQRQAVFREIAGNRGPLLISVLTNDTGRVPPPDAQVLFEQPILTQPGMRRIAWIIPVSALSATLNALPARKASLEHIYDY